LTQDKAEDEAAGRKEPEEKCPKRESAEDEAARRKMAEEDCPGKRERADDKGTLRSVVPAGGGC
jgi:hypothetical protein